MIRRHQIAELPTVRFRLAMLLRAAGFDTSERVRAATEAELVAAGLDADDRAVLRSALASTAKGSAA